MVVIVYETINRKNVYNSRAYFFENFSNVRFIYGRLEKQDVFYPIVTANLWSYILQNLPQDAIAFSIGYRFSGTKILEYSLLVERMVVKF